MAKSNVCAFWKTYTSRGRGQGAVKSVSFPCEDRDLNDLETLLELAVDEGASVGSSRSGIFEIQTDRGVWRATKNVRITPANHVFLTWDEVEAEEALLG